MTALRDKAVTMLAWTILVLLFLLAPVLGSAASIIASAAAILLVPLVARRGAIADLTRQPTIVIFIAIFSALAVCFAITARAPRDVLFAFNFVSLPLTAAVYLAFARQESGGDSVRTIAILSLAGTMAALVVALNDIYLRGLQYVYGFNMGPHVVARLALVTGLLSCAGLLANRSPWRFGFYLGPLAALAVLYLSNTRGAVLALPPTAMVFVAFLLADRRDRLQGVLLATVGVVAVAALLLTSDRIASIGRIAEDLLAGQAVSDSSTLERLGMLSAAWQLFLASPVIGHGWANFAAVAYPILQGSVWGGPTDPFFQFHNDLANFAVAAGIVGVACWIALLAAPVVGALASPRDAFFRVRLYCCVQLSVAYFVFGLTDFTLGYDLPTTLYAFLTAIVLGAFREPSVPAPDPIAEATRPAT
jgi:O-antigen ligase